MAVAAVLPLALQQFLDANENPLVGGHLWSYTAGTTTPQALYTDSALSVAFTNPIILNALGQPSLTGSGVGKPVYMLSTAAYKLLLTDVNNVTQAGWPVDDIAAPLTTQTVVSVPTGGIIDFGGTVAPTGYLLCDGSAVSRATYAALFAVTGTVFGVGNGTTTFNVPDFRGRSSLGTGNGSGLTPRAIGASGGEETHVLVTAELASHTHTATQAAHTHTVPHDDPSGNGPNVGGTTSSVNTVTTSSATPVITVNSAGSNTGHNTMHVFLVSTRIIKT